jgi:hypothetical protein
VPKKPAPLEVRLIAASKDPIKVKHLDAPPTITRPKKIHPRHLLPLVREGAEREFHSTTPRLAIQMPAPVAAGSEIGLALNTALTAPGQQQTASNVDEPSVAINGDVVFYTGNWYAAVSTNGGRSFSFVNPATAFKDSDPPNSSFCCDQVVQYIKAIDTFVWLLQYGPDTGDNIQRLAFAKTADVAAGRWHLFDITTKAVGAQGAFMDFPDLAVGKSCLYVTTNLFGPGDIAGSAVVRIPFQGIASGKVTARPFVSHDFQSFRVAQNCGATAYFAAHKDTSTLQLFSWPENQNNPTSQAIGVARWIGGNGYSTRTKDNRRWLDRADPRITGATLAGNALYFAWTVDTGSNHRPKPFIQIAKIDQANHTLLDNINIFDENSATAYGALATNSEGEVGISYMMAGGDLDPTHIVGILTNDSRHVVVSEGDRSPLDPSSGKGEWGDYLTVRPAYPNEKLFAATGFTMLGDGDGSNRDATPRFVIFGRASNVTAAGGTPTVPAVPVPDAAAGKKKGGGGKPPAGGGAPAGGVPTGVPFTDVNTLPVVNPAIAAQILAAAMQIGNAPQAMPEEQPLKFVSPEAATKPGVERWPVKTGQDPDVGLVGKNIIQGVSLGQGIVPATVEELIRINRPPDMRPATSIFPAFQNKRREIVETTVWQVEGDITVVKLEADGDYHLVIQGATGDTMIAEVPTPTTTFIGTSPWMANIKVARAVIDNTFVKHLNPADFVQMDGKLVPKESVSGQPHALPVGLPQSFVTPPEGMESSVPAFQTKVKPTKVRITGVGFFDADHGQTGVSKLNGIELHSALKVELL